MRSRMLTVGLLSVGVGLGPSGAPAQAAPSSVEAVKNLLTSANAGLSIPLLLSYLGQLNAPGVPPETQGRVVTTTGTYDSQGWALSLTGDYLGHELSMTLAGSLAGATNVVSWNGDGTYGDRVVTAVGEAVFSDLVDDEHMEFHIEMHVREAAALVAQQDPVTTVVGSWLARPVVRLVGGWLAQVAAGVASDLIVQGILGTDPVQMEEDTTLNVKKFSVGFGFIECDGFDYHTTKKPVPKSLGFDVVAAAAGGASGGCDCENKYKDGRIEGTVTATPEPALVLMLCTGLAGVAAIGSWRRKRAA
jgi:hypothetical protein